MSSVAPTNATVTPAGVVIFEYDGVIRAQAGSEVEAAALTGTISETQIADNAISTPKLQAASVITAKLAAAAVTAGKVAAEAIESSSIKAGAVVASKIAVAELSAITANLGTVTAGIIQGPTIRTGTVGARVQLSSSGLQAFNGSGEEVLNFSTATGNLFLKGEIKAGSTVPATTITGLLTNAQIAEIEAAKITGTIAETQIGPEAISTGKLKAGAVVTAKLAAGAVTAEKIAVAELSAITANLGTITAGTITGATFRTSASNPKVQMDSEGVRAINAEGATTVHLEPQGLKIRVISQEVPSEERKIRWVDSEGNVVATVYGARFGKVQEAWLEGRPQTGGTNAHTGIVAMLGNNSVTFSANLSTTTANAEIDVFSSETHHRVTVWDKEERSAFLQLASLANRKIAVGVASVTFSGSTSSSTTTVTHGLGKTPTVVLATPQLGVLSSADTFEYTATTFKVAAFSQPSLTLTATVPWIAIG